MGDYEIMIKKQRVFLTAGVRAAVLLLCFFAGLIYYRTQTSEPPAIEDGNVSDTQASGAVDTEEAQKKVITQYEAEALCAEVLGDKAEENGFPISYKCIDEISVDGKMYYVMHMAWYVNNDHWSYIGNCYVSHDGEEIYDGIVSDGKYEMTKLRWKRN